MIKNYCLVSKNENRGIKRKKLFFYYSIHATVLIHALKCLILKACVQHINMELRTVPSYGSLDLLIICTTRLLFTREKRVLFLFVFSLIW